MVGSNDKTKENDSALKNYHGLSSHVIKNIHNMEINPKSIRHLYVIAIIFCVHQQRNTCIQDGGHTQEVSHDNLNLPCWERDRDWTSKGSIIILFTSRAPISLSSIFLLLYQSLRHVAKEASITWASKKLWWLRNYIAPTCSSLKFQYS